MLINCAAYKDGHRVADIAVEQISDYIARPDHFVWVALRNATPKAVSYTHLRAHETVLDLVCRLLLEKKKRN